MSIPYSLLGLLSTGEKYGQQLKAEFEANTGEMWPLNVGQVYTTLNRLERDGYVKTEPDHDAATRPYRITPAGQIELDLWLKADPGSTPPPRDELVMKIMIAVSIDAANSVEVVQSHRRQLLQEMRRYTTVKASPITSTPGLMMCDAELFRLEAAVRWLDSVDARIRSGAQVKPVALRSEEMHSAETSKQKAIK